MPNFFDQFDAAQPTAKSVNFFDQFDKSPSEAASPSGNESNFFDQFDTERAPKPPIGGGGQPQRQAPPQGMTGPIPETGLDLGTRYAGEAFKGRIGLDPVQLQKDFPRLFSGPLGQVNMALALNASRAIDLAFVRAPTAAVGLVRGMLEGDAASLGVPHPEKLGADFEMATQVALPELGDPMLAMRRGMIEAIGKHPELGMRPDTAASEVMAPVSGRPTDKERPFFGYLPEAQGEDMPAEAAERPAGPVPEAPKPPEETATPQETAPEALKEPVQADQALEAPERREKAPQSLLAFLKAKGGIKDEGGELGAMDAHKSRPGLVNNKTGLSLDKAREAAQEAGYLGHEDPNAPAQIGTGDLLQAIDRELRGEKVYSERDREQLERFEAQNTRENDPAYREHLFDGLKQRADRLGVSYRPDTTPEELAADVFEREAIMAERGTAEASGDEGESSAIAMANEVFPEVDWRNYGEKPEGQAEFVPGHAGEAERARPAETASGEAQGAGAPRASLEGRPEAEGEGAGPRGEPKAELTEQGEQFIMPGAERSAKQAQVAREGHGRIRKGTNEPLDYGLFSPRKIEEPALPLEEPKGAASEQPISFGPFQDRREDFTNFVQEEFPGLKPGDEAHHAARTYVLRRGTETGNEHLVAYDEDSRRYAEAGTSNQENAATFSNDLNQDISDPNRNVVVHHNHLSGLPISKYDIAALGGRGLKAIFAHDPNGDFSMARLSPQMRRQSVHLSDSALKNRLWSIAGAAHEAAARIIDPLVKAGAMDVEQRHVLVLSSANRGLHGAGIIDYMESHKVPERFGQVFDEATRQAASVAADKAYEEGFRLGAQDDSRVDRAASSALSLRGFEQALARISGAGEGAPGGLGSQKNFGEGRREKPEVGTPVGTAGSPSEGGGLAQERPVAERLRNAASVAGNVVRDIQMKLTPMATGSDVARATAKDFANEMRLSRYRWSRIDDYLVKNFKPEELQRMWDAADAESVARQKGGTSAEFAALTPKQRQAVEILQADANDVYRQAQKLGMVKSEGLPSYVPRMVVEMGTDGAAGRIRGEAGPHAIDPLGRNLKTTTSQLRHREYLTREETEAAASQALGKPVAVLRDIRTLPLATARLREAVAGRTLIDQIGKIGKETGQETVHEGGEPEGSAARWFTIDHPSFKTWRPKFTTDAETGKVTAVKDAEGNTVFERVPRYVREDFEGPLRAVLTKPSGAVYNGTMKLKGNMMSAIMYSPLIHNAVEWGRALPAMPGKTISFKIYFEGNRAKNDVGTMTEAIRGGLDPIGHRYFNQDISAIIEQPNLVPGRSWTAKILGAVPGLFDPRAGVAVKRAIDSAGDFWHNTLLWDRVGDLQMGLYTNLRDHYIEKGIDPVSAQRIAAHFANRYAGSLPAEAMSSGARKIANMLLFSRSFTLGNIGAMKDMIVGLPKDVQAQILRDTQNLLDETGRPIGEKALDVAKNTARRKAIATIALDIGLFYVGNSLLQSASNVLLDDKTLSQEGQDYARRLKDTLRHVYENPLDMLNPFGAPDRLAASAENEPGKRNRVLVGYEKDGTAIYARNPTGKIGEEMKSWLTEPVDILKRKLNPFPARVAYEIFANDRGFGRKLYDPYDETPAGWVKNIGRIVWSTLEGVTPSQSIKAAWDLAHGRGSAKMEAMEIAGPLFGVTFSHGAPGGPAVGELYRAQEEHRFAVQQALPSIRQKIQDDDISGAVDDMVKLGIPRGLMNFYIRSTLNPGSRLTHRNLQDFMLYATPEQVEQMSRAMGQNQ